MNEDPNEVTEESPDSTNTGARKPKRGRKPRSRSSRTPSPEASTAGGSFLTESVGIGKVSFLPQISDPESEPVVMLRTVCPFEATFAFGEDTFSSAQWTLGADKHHLLALSMYGKQPEVHNPHPLMKSLTDKSAQLLVPYSKVADHTLEVMWPIYNSLFQSSPRDAIALSFSDFITILARVHFIYCTLISLINLTATSIAAREAPEPFMNNMLTNLGVKMHLYKAVTKAELERLVRKVAFLPVIPGIASESNRMLSNFVNPLMPEGITIPIYGSLTHNGLETEPSTAPKDVVGTSFLMIDAVIDSLVGTYSTEIAYMKLFMSGTIGNSGVLLPQSVGADPLRSIGFYNTPSDEEQQYMTTVGRQALSYRLGDGVDRDSTIYGSNTAIRTTRMTTHHVIDEDLAKPNVFTDIVQPAAYASAERPFYYTMMGDPIVGELINSSFFWDNGGTTGLSRSNTLATPHYIGTCFLLCEETRELKAWPQITSGHNALLVKIDYDGGVKTAAVNWFRKLGYRDIRRSSAVNSPTFYAGLRRSILSIRLAQIAFLKYNTEVWQHTTLVAMDEAQGGKFVVPAAPLAKAPLA